MSIQGEIDRINNNVSDALAATAEMGASVPETANSNDLGRLIRSIPQSGGGGTSINVTAEVGQTIVVKAVDENGKPTAWESADYQPRTHWMERVELLPETTVEIDPNNGMGATPVDFALEAGKPYTIKYNGVEYADCVGVELEEGVIYFGNLSAMDESFPVTEHPFVVMYGVVDIDGDGNIDHIVVVMPLDGSESVTLSILGDKAHTIPQKYIPQQQYVFEIPKDKFELFNEDTDNEYYLAKMSEIPSALLKVMLQNKPVFLKITEAECNGGLFNTWTAPASYKSMEGLTEEVLNSNIGVGWEEKDMVPITEAIGAMTLNLGAFVNKHLFGFERFFVRFSSE